MFMLTRVKSNGRVDVLFIMQHDNVERIKEYDPVELDWQTMPKEYANRLPATIGITFATDEDLAEIMRLLSEGKKNEAFKFSTRGFRFQPERGDHDGGPTKITVPHKA